jgi:hypothetical protein
MTISKGYFKRILQKDTSVVVLWLKFRNLEGFSGEHPKLRAAGQGGRVLKNYLVRHPFRKTLRR